MIKNLISYILFIFVFTGYLFTLAPTITMIDSGELATVCHTLGVAHPTGYPLYTLLGRIFSWLPVGSIAYRMNVMSAVISALGAVMFFQLLRMWLRCTLSALAGALLLAFSRTYWQQATTNEVYGLTALFLIGLLWILTKHDQQKHFHFFFIFCFFYGLAFTNHLSIIFSIPGVLFFLFYRRLSFFRQYKILLIGFGLFLIGISLYLYLPIRANQDPFLNWGDPGSIRRFLNHITGKQYRVWMFTQGMEVLIRRLSIYFRLASHQFSIPLAILAGMGLVISLFKNRKLGIFFLLLFGADVLYTLNYDIPDIDPYFLPSFIVMAIGLGFAIKFIKDYIEKITQLSFLRHGFAVVLLFLFLIPLFQNHYVCNQSQYYFAYDFGLNLIRSTSGKSIVMTKIWDSYSPLLYQQQIERRAPHLVMIDIQLFQNRPWYVEQRLRLFPHVIGNAKTEIEAFLGPLYDFAKGHPDVQKLRYSYINALNAIAQKNINDYQLYALALDPTHSERGFVPSYYAAPSGVLLELRPQPLLSTTVPFILRGWDDQQVYKNERTYWYWGRYAEPQ